LKANLSRILLQLTDVRISLQVVLNGLGEIESKGHPFANCFVRISQSGEQTAWLKDPKRFQKITDAVDHMMDHIDRKDEIEKTVLKIQILRRIY
jgi:hypothetical protein